MTKYSEVKKRIKLLKHYGWRKGYSLPCYLKTWDRGGYRYGQMLTIDSILLMPLDFLVDLLEENDRFAEEKLREKICQKKSINL